MREKVPDGDSAWVIAICGEMSGESGGMTLKGARESTEANNELCGEKANENNAGDEGTLSKL
jgi:hypothetical protein